MNPALVVSIIIAVIAMISSLAAVLLSNYLARRNAGRAAEELARATAQKVDAAAYERAQDTYERALAEQDTRVQLIQADLDQRREEYLVAQERLSVLEADQTADSARMRRLETEFEQLKQWASDLVASLRARRIKFTPPPINLSDPDDGEGEGG